MGQNNRPQQCLTIIKAQMVMKELHEGPLGRHFVMKIMQRNITRNLVICNQSPCNLHATDCRLQLS
jgi:hypothetical protein